jgi:hypothetical protein
VLLIVAQRAPFETSTANVAPSLNGRLSRRWISDHGDTVVADMKMLQYDSCVRNCLCRRVSCARNDAPASGTGHDVHDIRNRKVSTSEIDCRRQCGDNGAIKLPPGNSQHLYMTGDVPA